ncbi:hypothetical protein [Pseudomonas aeruginosa]|uniref:Transmembrane protein n=1 Tax=Pseudomonas aeruginosa TaxID=287 RepID=A0A6A9K2U2_PSEAI|nr:hypothetical protein [Pseudomonas aeruginosa]MUI61965.1 hypothetical protein [Pseudomonas aeruginosa]HBN8422659.1 hypothetical protein [Pseudomonas aeruginosa]HCI2100083.1 hypothetical protein [Pseudomonas aeruginosa]
MTRKIFGVLEIKHGVTKRGVILLWGIAVSIILYALSAPINAKETNLLFSIVSFGAVLFGGGAAYHMISLMIECPQNDKNFNDWIKLIELLLKVYMGFALVVLSLGAGIYFKGIVGLFILLAGYASGFIWASYKIIDSHKLIKKIINNS